METELETFIKLTKYRKKATVIQDKYLFTLWRQWVFQNKFSPGNKSEDRRVTEYIITKPFLKNVSETKDTKITLKW